MANSAHDQVELIDIVDKHNNIIGQSSRADAHKNNLMHRATHVFVQHRNYIFLQLRAADKAQFPNLWDISAAGHVIAGDSYSQTAIKELKEELDITVDTIQLIEIGSLPACVENGFEFIQTYCIKFDTLPEITLAQQEIATGAWFQIDHITYWLSIQPQVFAGCFDLIWQQFLER